jgi:hypothetical protein
MTNALHRQALTCLLKKQADAQRPPVSIHMFIPSVIENQLA